MKPFRTYLLLLSFCLISWVLPAKKPDGLTIEKAKWEKAVKGIDYTENYKEFDKSEKKDLDINPPLHYNLSPLKYVFYFIVVGLVIFLIVKIILNLNKNPNIKKQKLSVESLKEIEEKIHEVDLEQLLLEALADKNYHIAMRLNFLIIIKLLSEKKLIDWAKEKTNWEYFSEIKNALLKDGFKKIVIIFEPVWYGEYILTEDSYYKLQPTFDHFKKQLATDE